MMLPNASDSSTFAVMPDVSSLSTGRFSLLIFGALFVLASVSAGAIQIFIFQ